MSDAATSAVPEPVMDAVVEPFETRTDPAVIDDLRARLRATRWPDAPASLSAPGADPWALGADVAELRELAAYWADGFDWAASEAEFGADGIERLRVRLDGPGTAGIHVLRRRAVGVPVGSAPTVLLCHGWPDSAWRYLRVIPLLADPASHGGDPADAVDVVVPEMPGYGWSEAPSPSPIDAIAVAALWARLMSALGVERFAVAGGDIGGHVARYLALDFAHRVTAVHRIDGGIPVPMGDTEQLTPEEQAWFAEARDWGAAEGAYGAMHATKPQTAAVGLTDSPAGLLAWIAEKLRSWSDGDALLDVYSRDDVLQLVTQYWVTGTIGSSMRMYSANAAVSAEQRRRRVEVPSGFSIFPGDLVRAPRAWLERTSRLVWHSEPERGGHFAPREQPELYVRELQGFLRSVVGVGGGSGGVSGSGAAQDA